MILLLEDQPLVMKILVRILRPRPVVQAATALEALRLFATHAGDIRLMIADVTLPVGSGVQVASVLRSLDPNLGLILTSGYPVTDWSEKDTAELSRIGESSVCVLLKPFRAQTLLLRVEEMIGPNGIESARTA